MEEIDVCDMYHALASLPPAPCSQQTQGPSHPLAVPVIARYFMPFCPDKSFVFVAGISRTLRDAWKIQRTSRGTVMCGPRTSCSSPCSTLGCLCAPVSAGEGFTLRACIFLSGMVREILPMSWERRKSSRDYGESVQQSMFWVYEIYSCFHHTD